MNIIDMTGISGSGKSYIQNILKNDKNIIIIEDRFYFLQDILYIVYFFKTKNRFTILKKAIEISFMTNFSIFNKINLIRNILKKFGKDTYLKKKFNNSSKIIIVDEGLVHLYQNIISGTNKYNNKLLNKIDSLLKIVNYSNKILIIEASKNTIRNRLIKRGHKRVDFTKINDFIETSIYNIKYVKTKYIKITIITNSKLKEKDIYKEFYGVL